MNDGISYNFSASLVVAIIFFLHQILNSFYDFLGWHFKVQKNGKFRSTPSVGNYKAFRKKVKNIVNNSNYDATVKATSIPLDDYLAKIQIIIDLQLFLFGSFMAG